MPFLTTYLICELYTTYITADLVVYTFYRHACILYILGTMCTRKRIHNADTISIASYTAVSFLLLFYGHAGAFT